MQSTLDIHLACDSTVSVKEKFYGSLLMQNYKYELKFDFLLTIRKY